ncbi:MAG: hypothetical protein M1827_003151 [Pycnora praestabilis]|nr:MAG: hypothetical protein M1827_003151 [Pycnora praestabilis]
MKTSNPVAVNGAVATSNRRQPVRQTRTNPSRTTTTATRPFGGRSSASGGLENGQNSDSAPGFFPAITHFTNSIAALPKEIIRHFTLLKEVDAKAYGPEDTLNQLVGAALAAPTPVQNQRQIASQVLEGAAVGGSNTASVNGSVLNGTAPTSQVSQEDVEAATRQQSIEAASEFQRSQVFYGLRSLAADMLVTLDEKNHVISTATEALNKQLMRCDSSFPYIEGEISEEARCGSLTHWAYADKTLGKPNGTMAGERSRRDVAATNSLAAAAAAIHEGEAAASRSESRREAMLARKNRNHHVDSDLDEGHGGLSSQGTIAANAAKKPHGNTKLRKTAESGVTSNGGAVGLGITNGAAALISNPPNKRRKTEKAANSISSGGVAMERSISAVLGNGVSGKGTAGSYRETPALEGIRKRARGGGTAGTGRKRNNTSASGARSPSLASSPIHSTFAAAKEPHRSSPAPAQRPQSSRARQSSNTSVIHDAQIINTRQRPSSSASNKPSNGVTASALEINSVAGLTGRSVPDVKNSMKDSTNNKGEHMIEDADNSGKTREMKGALVVGKGVADGRSSLKREETNETNGATIKSVEPTPTATNTTTTRGGKASKTSTPITANFPPISEPTRSRSSRAAAEAAATTAKRSHKKGAGAAAQQLIAAAAAAADNNDEGSSMQGDDEDDEDGDGGEDEPRYCYCNQVSYGEMVGCDAGDKCEREWFHLDCVGLSRAPNKNGEISFSPNPP